MSPFNKSKWFILLFGIASFALGAFIAADDNLLITREDVQHAEKINGMDFTPKEIDSLIPLLLEQKANLSVIDKFQLSNAVPPAILFNPLPDGLKWDKSKKAFKTSSYTGTLLPKNKEELAYYSLGQLGELIKTKQISSVELTNFFLERLKKHNKQLHCVITFTDELALQQAQKADQELKAGKYRGLLHGIPYGIKDMFSTKKYPTTFGTPPYKDQLINEDATVVKKLQDAGAVLIAKLSLGELALDDVWFGGQTRNPWDTTKGSSGSSAGPASAVSAGLVPFAIGSETWGSIVSPSTVCGTSGLRPTYGRVSRYGAMALSWSMDKIGPICHYIEDCAIVFECIYGPDGKDQTLYDASFNYQPVASLKGMKIGYIQNDFTADSANKKFNDAAFQQLEKLGAKLVPIALPKLPIFDLNIILLSEAAAAFNELTTSNRDDQMVQQARYRWPNIFRAAHFIPATEYIQANRIRYLLIQEMHKIMQQVDVCIAPSLMGDNLLLTNLTGHPCTVVPNGFSNPTTPTSIVFIGQLFGEGSLLAITKAYQDATKHHMLHPKLN